VSESGRSSSSIEGWGILEKVVPVDQAVLGKTPRSNPAVYIGAFDHIRDCFAQSEVARQRGLGASAFSFNSGQGQCERCHGAGFEKIEMQFLSDVFVRCPHCNGRRYRKHILDVKIKPTVLDAPSQHSRFRVRSIAKDKRDSIGALSIADLLDSTVEEAISFLSAFSDSKPATKATESLRLLFEVGLGYLKLGQPLNTLSGGESQRLKLVRHLADSQAGVELAQAGAVQSSRISFTCASNHLKVPQKPAGSTLFLFDEPTTGLHFDDIRVLMKVFQRLVDAGHSVLVVEHNLDVIKCADWVIDLGPEGGEQGGQLVAQGTPEQIAACERSHTGQALRSVLPGQKSQRHSLRAA
jgi:excinuclease ABC subunit A